MNDYKMMMLPLTPRIPHRDPLSGCPVHSSAEVMVEFRDGCIELDTASLFEWSAGAWATPESDIVAFWVISSPNLDDITRYQQQEAPSASSEPKRAADAITFPPDVSGEPCDGVLLVLDDGSEVPVEVTPGCRVAEEINRIGEVLVTRKALNLLRNGRIILTQRIVDVFAIVGGKAVGRG